MLVSRRRGELERLGVGLGLGALLESSGQLSESSAMLHSNSELNVSRMMGSSTEFLFPFGLVVV